MKRKVSSILIISGLLLSLLPMGIGVAATGAVTALATNGYSAEPGNNKVTATVTDSDLNVAALLDVTKDNVVTFDGKPFELLKVADGTKSFTGSKTPVADTSGDGFVNFADVDLRVLQKGTQGEGLTITAVTTSTGQIDSLLAPTQDDNTLADLFTLAGITADAGTAAASVANDFKAPSQPKVTITRTTDGDASLTVKVGCLTTDRDAAGAQIAKTLTSVFTHGLTPDPLIAVLGGADFCTAFSNTMDATGADSATGTVAVFVDFSETVALGDAFSVTIEETNTVAANYKQDIPNNTDTTATTPVKTVNVNSSTDPTGLSVTAIETGASTNAFQKDVVLITVPFFNAITKELADDPDLSALAPPNTGTLTQLMAGLNLRNLAGANIESTTEFAEDQLVATWLGGVSGITLAANAPVLDASTGTKLVAGDTIATLQGILLRVSHGDQVTVTYSDQAPAVAVAKAATIDTTKPTIANASPADNTFTTDATPTLTGTVTDVNAGINSANIVVKVDGIPVNAALVSKDPITNGFSVTFIAGAFTGSPPSAHTWELVVTDKVGNSATTGTGTSIIDFTVDTQAPALLTAEAGIGLKLTTGKTDEYEEFFSADWVKTVFSEDVNPDSATTGDFDVEGSSPPASILIAKKLKTISAAGVLGALALTEEQNVYLNLTSAADANATPKVTLTGAVSDTAGNNSATGSGTAKTSSDKIQPTLTASVDTLLGKKDVKVVIAVSSDEPLLGPPVVTVTNGTTAGVTNVGVSGPAGANSWSGTFTIDDAAVYTVGLTGTDKSPAANKGTKALTFQGDDAAPTIGFNVVADQKIETDEVTFVQVNFGDTAEYTGDTFLTVSITSAKLESLASKAGAVTDTATLAPATDFQTNDTKSYVYGAADLGIGFYKLSVTGADSAGNSVTGSVAFEIIAPQPVAIAIRPGWNLVSLPGSPQDKSIANVLMDTSVTQVWSFNNETKIWEFARLQDGAWEGTLIQMVDGRSYFVRSATFDAASVLLTRFSPQRVPPQYSITKGWNGIGYTPGGKETSNTVAGYLSSLAEGNDAGWGVIRWWNPILLQYESAWQNGNLTAGFPVIGAEASVNSGNGYLLFATRDGTLAP